MDTSSGAREGRSEGAGHPAESVSFPVPLNHFFVAPDPQTYQAIATSEFLRHEFAVTETRTTVRGDVSYTGLYLYGTNTYCEFLGAINDPRIGPGDSAVAFGVEHEAGLEAIAAADPSDFPVAAPLVTREYNGRLVPWFFMASPKSLPYAGPSGFSVWLMEYHPRFLVEWHGSDTGSKSILRADILSRYIATRPATPARPLFQDVTGLTVALDEVQTSNWIRLCRVCGYRVNTSPRATVLYGPDLILTLVPATEAVRGIREITLRLHPDAPRGQEYQLGVTVLTFRGDGTGTWAF